MCKDCHKKDKWNWLRIWYLFHLWTSDEVYCKKHNQEKTYSSYTWRWCSSCEDQYWWIPMLLVVWSAVWIILYVYLKPEWLIF